MNNVNHRINHYPANNVVRFANTYPLDSDLFGLDSVIQPWNNLGQGYKSSTGRLSTSKLRVVVFMDNKETGLETC